MIEVHSPMCIQAQMGVSLTSLIHSCGVTGNWWLLVEEKYQFSLGMWLLRGYPYFSGRFYTIMHTLVALSELSRLKKSGDPSHNQPPNTDTIAYASKFLLKGPCLLWGYAGAWQTQKWMLTVSYWMEHRAPNCGARESNQGAEGVCNPIGGTTIWTNQFPRARVSSCTCSRKWPSCPSLGGEALDLAKIICPSSGDCQGQEAGMCGLGNRLGVGIGDFQGSIWNVNEENI
jgi:hypothetical protein